MLNLPLALRQAKNQMGQDSPWLIMIDLDLTSLGGPLFNLVANNADIPFQGRTYTAFPFQVDFPKESGKGEIPQLKLMISNVTRLLQAHMEELNGGVGAPCTLYIVNAGLLSENYAELTMDFTVTNSECSAQWVSITLGAPNPLHRRFPLHRYIANHCAWQFKSAECAYSGSDTTCKRTLDDCTAKANAARFGGQPGLTSTGLRLA